MIFVAVVVVINLLVFIVVVVVVVVVFVVVIVAVHSHSSMYARILAFYYSFCIVISCMLPPRESYVTLEILKRTDILSMIDRK